MDWSFLIPGEDNLVTDDGYRYWTTGAINCKEKITEPIMCSATMRGINTAQWMAWPVSSVMIIRMLL